MLPSLFVAHGSPMIAIEASDYGAFLDGFGQALPRPRALVVFSAHWESPVQQIGAVAGSYETIYDFGGFPDELYQVVYPAHGDPLLAEQIAELLRERGIESSLNTRRGLDHGAWTLLRRLFPAADVPVVPMSVNAALSPAEQFRIGESLASLRDHNILVIGSGVTVHNFQLLRHTANPDVHAAVQAFERWLQEKLQAWDLDALFHYADEAPNARLAVPAGGSEHFAPLFYAMGAAGPDAAFALQHQSWMWGVMSNSVFQFS